MKADHHWTFGLFLMAVLCLTLSADKKPEVCETEIRVRRDTNYSASVGQKLQLSCPVHLCNNTLPTITWIKMESENITKNIWSTRARITIKWLQSNNAEKIFALIFQKVLKSDSGLYRCEMKKPIVSVSHFIKVTVTDELGNDITTSQEPTSTINTTFTDNNQDPKQVWLYVYTAAGIVGFVIIVIVISVLSMRGCKGERKDYDQSQNQYLDIPMIEQRVHHSSNQALPRASVCGTPSHRTSRKKKSPSASAQRDNVYDQIEGPRTGQEQEGSSVVYAALNHEHLAGASPRPRTVVDERSEYAAIRVS